MDFSLVQLDADTRRFGREVRAFLDKHHTPIAEHRADELTFERGPDPDFVNHLASKGWITPEWPVEEGGAGLSPIECWVLSMEFARRHVPELRDGRIERAVRRFGGDALKAEYLQRAARGRAIACLGYSEPDSGSDLAAAKAKATLDSEGWIINGQKTFTTKANYAHYCWLLTRTNQKAPKHSGLTMFLVPMDTPGIQVLPIQTLAGSRTNSVFFSDVRVLDKYRVGSVDDGWNVVAGPLYEEHGALSGDRVQGFDPINGQGVLATKALEDLLERAEIWARSVSRSDGTLPINDPIVRRHLAQVALDIEVCWNTPAEMGKVIASETFVRVSAEIIDLIGPGALLNRGVSGSTGDGMIAWAHRYAQGTVTWGGTVEVFRNNIAQRRLGLPRPPSPVSAR